MHTKNEKQRKESKISDAKMWKFYSNAISTHGNRSDKYLPFKFKCIFIVHKHTQSLKPAQTKRFK